MAEATAEANEAAAKQQREAKTSSLSARGVGAFVKLENEIAQGQGTQRTERRGAGRAALALPAPAAVRYGSGEHHRRQKHIIKRVFPAAAAPTLDISIRCTRPHALEAALGSLASLADVLPADSIDSAGYSLSSPLSV